VKGDLNKKSILMHFCSLVGFDSYAWALRRFYTPVPKKALVLEVGSGGNPYPRANVLLDAYESTRERHWAPLTSDRPTVLGFVENLPFKDKSFDYVIASHVLEHSTNPEKFISELQRVAKAGYIEVPDAFLERINPYKDHRLEITLRDETLNITKKKNWIHDPEVVALYENHVKLHLTKMLIPKRPFVFHVRYYWFGEIKYHIVNPEVDVNWRAPESDRLYLKKNFFLLLREFVRNILRDIFSQRERNKRLDIKPLLRCTNCYNDIHLKDISHMVCAKCQTVYSIKNGIYVMKN
jgi:SAM-dependent methyltransferase